MQQQVKQLQLQQKNPTIYQKLITIQAHLVKKILKHKERLLLNTIRQKI